ncbi:Adult-specific cuticular protein ACP-20 [Amphibalanus amphitrite]|uniref:Adult-specific cuticular protein ACP-20 n=1 Tax=Amphibalanus amphitrite TaxID=1232801 RepID=A0A6A4WN55_AMPAM|nr:adult-specific cuticular protein ACP-20-like [Amphibalanus amphitrite]KAF0307473.1 Adult-specific cuticular protein ACP-20 [Amphibalanus amphitrite]
MKLIVIAAVLALAVADSGYQSNTYDTNGYGTNTHDTNGYGTNGYGTNTYDTNTHGTNGYGTNGYKNDDLSEPTPYEFGYAVNDHYQGAVFSQNEQADAYGNVEGYYSVNLPDGRVQHVKYVANDYGNNAEVTYTGEAQHPGYTPTYGQGNNQGYNGQPAYSQA